MAKQAEDLTSSVFGGSVFMGRVTRAKGNESASSTKRSNKSRFTIDLPDAVAKQMEELKEEMGAQSYAEVVRDALRLYFGLAREAKNGGELLIIDKEGARTKIKLFI